MLKGRKLFVGRKDVTVIHKKGEINVRKTKQKYDEKER
jgi:hypothetical protein